MAAADVARRLIAKHGRSDGALRRGSLSTEVPALKPWAPQDKDPATSDLVASGLSVVVLDALTALRPGDLLPQQTAVAYLDADVEPLKLDVLETQGERYAVLEVEELAPGPTTALYTLHLRSA